MQKDHIYIMWPIDYVYKEGAKGVDGLHGLLTKSGTTKEKLIITY